MGTCNSRIKPPSLHTRGQRLFSVKFIDQVIVMMYTKPLLILIALVSLCGTGCASIDSFWESKPAYPMATKERPASQIIAMWHPAGGTHHGRPARGFAGNIMFFTARSAMPALVNGKVRVYLFEDQGTPEEQAKPIRQYDFPA